MCLPDLLCILSPLSSLSLINLQIEIISTHCHPHLLVKNLFGTSVILHPLCIFKHSNAAVHQEHRRCSLSSRRMFKRRKKLDLDLNLEANAKRFIHPSQVISTSAPYFINFPLEQSFNFTMSIYYQGARFLGE